MVHGEDQIWHLFKFTKNILLGKPIDVFNNGNHVRDFTYVDDIVESIFKIVIKKEKKKLYKIYNIGNGKKIKTS
jgi:UDP-glucuronate 4-epimerase